LSKGSESKVRHWATVVFCFTSDFVFHQNRIEIVWPYWNLFLLTCNWAEQINPYWLRIGQLRGTWWIIMWSVNEGGSNFMHGSLFMHYCSRDCNPQCNAFNLKSSFIFKSSAFSVAFQIIL
jgi:hypothetical protein